MLIERCAENFKSGRLSPRHLIDDIFNLLFRERVPKSLQIWFFKKYFFAINLFCSIFTSSDNIHDMVRDDFLLLSMVGGPTIVVLEIMHVILPLPCIRTHMKEFDVRSPSFILEIWEYYFLQARLILSQRSLSSEEIVFDS
jgi:hypothetical protein